MTEEPLPVRPAVQGPSCGTCAHQRTCRLVRVVPLIHAVDAASGMAGGPQALPANVPLPMPCGGGLWAPLPPGTLPVRQMRAGPAPGETWRDFLARTKAPAVGGPGLPNGPRTALP